MSFWQVSAVAIRLASIAVTDASKIALVALVELLRAQKFALLDTQWLTPHLQQFGGIEISRDNYLRVLRRAVELPREF
jgi:leucyl/phenylalanyl-tRNA---protein transferase